MSPYKQRLVDLAAGWEDSDADVGLSPQDAAALGVKVVKGKPPTIKGHELFDRANALPDDFKPSTGGEPTPVQQSISPGPGGRKTGPAGGGKDPDPATRHPSDPSGAGSDPAASDDGLEKKLVEELRAIASAEKVPLNPGAVKAQIIDAIRAARKAAAG